MGRGRRNVADPGEERFDAGRDHEGQDRLLILRRGLRHGARGRPRSRHRCPAGARRVRRQGPPHQLRASLHEGGDQRGDAGRRRTHGDRVPSHRTRRHPGARGRRRRDRRHGPPVAGGARRARPRRPVLLRLRTDVARGAVPGDQAREGIRRYQQHRVQLPVVHGRCRHRLQAVARRGRPARLLPGLRPRRPVLRQRREHGRLPSHPLPQDDEPGQGRGQTRRRRPPAHPHRREGGPVPADRARDRPGAAQRPVAPDRRERARRPGLRGGVHRGLGGHASLPRGLHARARRGDHRAGRGRHPHGRAVDRRGGQLDVVLDDGPEPEHARHLEHQCGLQPAPGHRRDLSHRQRPLLAHRSAQRDGRARDGVHGARSAGAAVRSRRRRADLRRAAVGAAGRCDPHHRRQGHDRHVRADGRRCHPGLLDHLHQSGCLRG